MMYQLRTYRFFYFMQAYTMQNSQFFPIENLSCLQYIDCIHIQSRLTYIHSIYDTHGRGQCHSLSCSKAIFFSVSFFFFFFFASLLFHISFFTNFHIFCHTYKQYMVFTKKNSYNLFLVVNYCSIHRHKTLRSEQENKGNDTQYTANLKQLKKDLHFLNHFQ